ATMSWDDIGRGLTLLAGSLAILVIAMTLMHSKIFAAASLFIVASAITVLSGALKILGSMSWDEIGRGLTMLGASLAILAIALYAMSGGIAGAAAITIVSIALAMLVPILK